MAVSQLLTEGVWLMLLGMGIVFAFLIVLVFALHGMSRLAGAIERWRGVEPSPAEAQVAPGYVEHGADGELIAVISAAIARYRSSRH